MSSLVNAYKRNCVEQMKRADLLQADLDKVDDLHAAECEAYEARIKELIGFILSLQLSVNDEVKAKKLLEKTK